MTEPESTDRPRRERRQTGVMARRPARRQAGGPLSAGNAVSTPGWGRAAGSYRSIRARTRGAARRRLDTPQEGRRGFRRPDLDTDALGIFAEQFARFLGTARFLFYMTVFVAGWIGWNASAPAELRWDRYPFIFLTLILSLQASYAAPLILLAQNRQETRDKIVAEQDRQANARAHADMEYLAREIASLRMAVGEVATRDYIRAELRGLLAERGDAFRHESSAGPDDAGSGGRAAPRDP
jgi:uncharacterized membrane protein